MILVWKVKRKPFHQRRPTQPLRCIGRLAAITHHNERNNDSHEGDGVEGIDHADVEIGHHQPRDGRADNARGGEHQIIQRDGILEVLRRHEMGHQRLTRRVGEGRHRRQAGRCQIDHGNADMTGQGQYGQDAGQQTGDHLGPNQQSSPVARVGQQTAQQGEGHNGNDPHQPQRAQAQCLGAQVDGTAEQADRERLAAQHVEDVPVDGHQLHLRADGRDEQPYPQQPIVTVLQGGRPGDGGEPLGLHGQRSTPDRRQSPIRDELSDCVVGWDGLAKSPRVSSASWSCWWAATHTATSHRMMGRRVASRRARRSRPAASGHATLYPGRPGAADCAAPIETEAFANGR